MTPRGIAWIIVCVAVGSLLWFSGVKERTHLREATKSLKKHQDVLSKNLNVVEGQLKERNQWQKTVNNRLTAVEGKLSQLTQEQKKDIEATKEVSRKIDEIPPAVQKPWWKVWR